MLEEQEKNKCQKLPKISKINPDLIFKFPPYIRNSSKINRLNDGNLEV